MPAFEMLGCRRWIGPPSATDAWRSSRLGIEAEEIGGQLGSFFGARMAKEFWCVAEASGSCGSREGGS